MPCVSVPLLLDYSSEWFSVLWLFCFFLFLSNQQEQKYFDHEIKWNYDTQFNSHKALIEHMYISKVICNLIFAYTYLIQLDIPLYGWQLHTGWILTHLLLYLTSAPHMVKSKKEKGNYLCEKQSHILKKHFVCRERNT